MSKQTINHTDHKAFQAAGCPDRRRIMSDSPRMETFNNWPIYNRRPSDRVIDALGLYAAALGIADNGGGCFEDVPDALKALDAAIRADFAESEAAAMRALRGGA